MNDTNSEVMVFVRTGSWDSLEDVDPVIIVPYETKESNALLISGTTIAVSLILLLFCLYKKMSGRRTRQHNKLD